MPGQRTLHLAERLDGLRILFGGVFESVLARSHRFVDVPLVFGEAAFLREVPHFLEQADGVVEGREQDDHVVLLRHRALHRRHDEAVGVLGLLTGLVRHEAGVVLASGLLIGGADRLDDDAVLEPRFPHQRIAVEQVALQVGERHPEVLDVPVHHTALLL